MEPIQRLGATRRWSDVVIHRGVAHFVEVAADPSADVAGQVRQVLDQIDATLTQLGADRTRVLQVTIYLQDLSTAPILNAIWDEFFPAGHAPVRACVQAGLSPGYWVEMAITAAVP
jgi:enamine deaminase RidA (YjgF/YER057c/UK114 family)